MTKELEKKIWDNGWEYDENHDNTISVNIEYGDWKHDHIHCDYIMRENGYVLTDEQVTWEDGSDCYSSIHTYRKITLQDLKEMLEKKKKLEQSLAK